MLARTWTKKDLNLTLRRKIHSSACPLGLYYDHFRDVSLWAWALTKHYCRSGVVPVNFGLGPRNEVPEVSIREADFPQFDTTFTVSVSVTKAAAPRTPRRHHVLDPRFEVGKPIRFGLSCLGRQL